MKKRAMRGVGIFIFTLLLAMLPVMAWSAEQAKATPPPISQPLVTEASVRKSFQEIFDMCGHGHGPRKWEDLPRAWRDTQEQLLIADLDLDLVREVRNTWQFYRDRRPEMYGDMADPTAI